MFLKNSLNFKNTIPSMGVTFAAMGKLYSMTGFGKSSVAINGKRISIELKSLNSKQFDLGLKLAPELKSLEANFRKLFSELLYRGKVEAIMVCEVTGEESTPEINKTLVKGYLKQLIEIKDETGVDGDLLSAVFRFPDVLQSPKTDLTEEEVERIIGSAKEACKNLTDFRANEGHELTKDLVLRAENIRGKLLQIPNYEQERRTQLHDKMQKALEQFNGSYDENRFEQEMIYYFEKLDITEEKVRLETHLNHLESLIEEGGTIGKKLNFISQEIGREINTIGSKASHAAIQKIVVEMKDELEKIKEQVLNIL